MGVPFGLSTQENFHGVVYFSTLDCASGYYQIKTKDSARSKTAFVGHMGLFEYVHMPFGLTNVLATFQRLMDELLSDLIGVCVRV